MPVDWIAMHVRVRKLSLTRVRLSTRNGDVAMAHSPVKGGLPDRQYLMKVLLTISLDGSKLRGKR